MSDAPHEIAPHDDHQARRGWLRRFILTRDNAIALALALLVIILLIVTADSTPTWIYQGF